jgi:hypothetical protein
MTAKSNRYVGHNYDVTMDAMAVFHMNTIKSSSIHSGSSRQSFERRKVSPGIIAALKASSKEVKQIVITPSAAGYLFQEGVLTANHFAEAQESPDSIELQNVQFGGHSYRVVIYTKLSNTHTFILESEPNDYIKDTFSGQNFCVSETSIVLYGYHFEMDSDGNWIINMLKHQPEPVSVQALQCIQRDTTDGLKDQIAKLGVTHFFAGNLFLEGILTYQHFLNAVELDECIILYGVKIGDEFYEIFIMPTKLAESTMGYFSVATLNANNQMI